MKLLDIYSYLISNWLNAGNFVNAGRMEATSIKPEYNVIFTKGYCKQIVQVVGIKPINIDICFIDYIRDRMFELHPDVETNILMLEYPVHMDVNSDKFKRALSRADEAYSTYREAFESQGAMDRLTGKVYRLPNGARLKLSREKMEALEQVQTSYTHLYKHITGGGTVAQTKVFIELIGRDRRSVRRAENDLYGVVGSANLGVQVVKAATKAYLWEMAPAVPAPKTLTKKFLPQLLFTDENTAAFSSYKSRGLVGGGKNALLLGMDFRSRLPFSIDIFRSASAQVFMLLGKTGSGKTYAAFQAAMSALALGEYVTAIDIKGREWAQMTPAADAKIITFDDKNPSFVNTLRLDDLDVSEGNASELFNTAIKGTVAMFMLVINLQQNEGNPNDAEMVIREAVMKMYSMRGIDPSNPSTFKDTKRLRYADVLPVLETLQTTTSYTASQRNMVTLARARLNAYFGDTGMFSDAFKNEISLSEVMEAPFVIYEFNKNQGAMTDSLDVVRIFMVQFLDSKKKAMLKLRGKFLFCFYEELQRCESFGDLLSYICGEVTGSRSNNAVIFLLLNSLKVLQGKSGQDIRSNITSFLTGFCEDNDIRTIREDFGKEWLAGQLSLFSQRQQIYRNCFAAYVDTGIEVLETVYKVMLPDSLSKAFRTRTIKEEAV